MTLPIRDAFDFFDQHFFEQPTDKSKYPRTTIYINNENKLIFNFALAGFSTDDIQITLDSNKLTIIGRKETKPLEAKKVFQNQIAYRDFSVLYRLPNEYTQEDLLSANFEKGILTIEISPILYVKEKVKTIVIKNK